MHSLDYGFLVTLRQLRAFETVARVKSLNAAAAEIRISQPAVWQAVTKLERAFGATLFERRPTGTYLNKSGELLFQRVERFIAQFEAAISDTVTWPADAKRLSRLQREITTAQLRLLLAVGEGGTFGEAARLLGVSEATLRRGARSLEQTIGRALFDRSAAGSVLNRAGAELARRLQLAIIEIRYAVEDLRSAEGDIAGRVVVGSLPLVQTLFLPRAIGMLLKRYPDAGVEIVEGSYALLMQLLRNGTLDMIVGALRTTDVPEDVVQESLFVDPFSIVLRKGHPLTRTFPITLDHLAKCEWVVPRKGTPIRGTFEALFAGYTPAPRANIETSSLSAIRAILVESDRLTILSDRQIAIDQRVGLLTALRYPLPVAGRPIGITTRRSWRLAFVQREFIRMLRRRADEFAASELETLRPFSVPVENN